MNVGEHASAAVLEPVFRVLEISSAFRAQGVKRTVAEEAVELLRFAGIVAGEKFTFFVLEKGKLFLQQFFDFFVCHNKPPCDFYYINSGWNRQAEEKVNSLR